MDWKRQIAVWIAGIGVLIFAVVAIHHWIAGPSVPRSPAEIAAAQEQLQLQAEIAAARRAEIELKLRGPCDKVKREYYFAPKLDPNRPVNQNGQCRAVFDLPDGRCVYQRAAVIKVFGLGEAQKEGPFGDCPTSVGVRGPDNVEYTWSEGAGFWGYVTLEPG